MPRIYMRALRLARHYGATGKDARFDAMQAAYWYCSLWYGGQGSALYAELSWITKYYRPGMLERAPEADSIAKMIYDALVAER